MRRFTIPVLFLIMVYFIGIFAYHNLEGWNYIDSIYFATATLTTVGFGDLHPTSDISKIFTVVYMWVGVGLGFFIITLLAGYYRDVISKKAENILKKGEKIFHNIEK
ncbi:MAG: two pore domain potassium channel family protein [Thaumarchaeota archaeon]|nr:two pore domain potassium channel family protein [Nitrososphaerota archaeon]